MYTFNIKNSSPDIKIVVTRSLLALAGMASLLYRISQYYFINIIAALTLFTAAVFINSLLKKLQFNTSLLLSIGAVILFTATHSIPFAVILVLVGWLIKKMYKEGVVNVNTKGVSITRMLGFTLHEWGELNNIILKDNLITFDFKNNKLLQLNITENNIDENSFNTFCSGFIGI